jgi:LacI family transcriptional regulator
MEEKEKGFIVTQKDVARAAGVARSTVSRALQNHHSIPLETRDRIRQIAQELGYCPNPFVTANMTQIKRSKRPGIKAVLAYLSPAPLSVYLSSNHYFESARQKAHQLGFELDPIAINESIFSGQQCTKILRARGIQGVIIAPFESAYIRIRLDWKYFASASIGYAMHYPRFSFATSSHFRNMSLTLRKLRHLGYQRIGIAMPARADHYTEGAFSAAYYFHMDNYKQKVRVPRFLPRQIKDWDKNSFWDWYMKFQPDAIICITDDIYTWLREKKVNVPNEVGLVALSILSSRHELSGINEQQELVGAAAVQLVVDQLMLNERGTPIHPKAVLIDGIWVQGTTIIKRRPIAL